MTDRLVDNGSKETYWEGSLPDVVMELRSLGNIYRETEIYRLWTAIDGDDWEKTRLCSKAIQADDDSDDLAEGRRKI